MTDLRSRALDALRDQTIELPSWAFGNSGTRFKVFGQPGVARDPFEKLEDAAQVHRCTGVAPRISLRIPWDLVGDFSKLASHAADLGVRIGGIQSNAQQVGDVLGANGVLMDAYNTDVRPLLAELRESQGLDADPYAACARSGYQERIARERVGGQQAGWGA